MRERGLVGAGVVAALAWGWLAWRTWQVPVVDWRLVLAIQGVGWGAWAGAVWWLRRRGDAGWRWIVAWSVAFRMLLGLAQPVLDDDAARYLWDGWRFLETGSPYGRPPAEFFGDSTVPEALQARLSEINHPDLPTVYGPVLQMLFGLAAWIRPGALVPLKFLWLVADLAVFAGVWRAGGVRAGLGYGWCPLVLFETLGNAHADVVGAGCIVAAWLWARRERGWGAAAWLGLAVGVKLMAVVLVPFVLLRLPWRHWILVPAVWAACCAPFWAQGGGTEWAGLRTMAAEWEFNSTLVGVLGAILEPTAARRVAAGCFVVYAAGLFVRWKRSPGEAVRLDWVYGGFLLASPVVNPWYLVWLAPWVAVWPSCWGWVAMGVVGLSYGTGLNLGTPGLSPYGHPWWVRIAEAGAIAVALAWDLARIRSRK